ncbi:MAG TPA: O-antigen ligase family protein [Candidatus Limnocylindrales bacterium]|nr:O-antigen ligase family protein [Candidatus Limnocylindrales bacterium]
MERLKRLPLWGVYALLAYMPFSLFFSRWLSLYTGGLGPWDASKDILTLLLLFVAVVLATQKRLLKDTPSRLLFAVLGLYFCLHLLFILINRNLDTRAAIVGTLYNGRVLAYFFIGLVTMKVYGQKILPTATKIVLVASTITCLFAIIQYVAPSNLMNRFGYSVERGAKPSFFIDDKPDFPRVMSTVRDPNSYGAYLIVPLALSGLYVLTSQNKKRKLCAGGLALLHAWALFLTFSRGAWIGAMVAGAIVVFYVYRTRLKKITIRFWPLIIVVCLLIAGLTFQFRNQYVFQNVFLHKDQKTVLTDPNELRIQLQKSTATAIIKHPEGHGPGTAGLASIGSSLGALLTENYYLQIAYEVGILGLLAFLFVLAYAYLKVRAAEQGNLQISLLAAFWAYLFISTLIHLWSNEAVAAQWWLLSGLVAANAAKLPKPGRKSA